MKDSETSRKGSGKGSTLSPGLACTRTSETKNEMKCRGPLSTTARSGVHIDKISRRRRCCRCRCRCRFLLPLLAAAPLLLLLPLLLPLQLQLLLLLLLKLKLKLAIVGRVMRAGRWAMGGEKWLDLVFVAAALRRSSQNQISARNSPGTST